MVRRVNFNESGQALVILVMAAVALLGFAALALDGGHLYFEQRRTQNSADNAVLAAALKATQGQDYVSEGLAIAGQNDYDNDGTSNWIQISGPSEGGPTSGTYASDTNYVEVVITQTVSTSFAHLVYSGPVQLTVRAVARAYPSNPTPLIPGEALVALSPDACDALNFHGNGDTLLTGGGAFSNSTAQPPPASCNSGEADGSSVVTTDGELSFAGSWDPGSATIVGSTNSYVPQLPPDQPSLIVDETSLDNLCAALPDYGNHDQNGGLATITAGRYDRVRVLAGGILTMEPGLYCITGADGYDTSGGTISGEGVLIYLWTGGFETNGNATNLLSAPTDLTCTSPPSDVVPVCDFQGLLLYTREGNTSDIRVNGGADSVMTGTFYAQDSHIEITGNAGTFVLNAQVIGDTIDVGGNGTVNITYDPSQIFLNNVAPQIELSE